MTTKEIAQLAGVSRGTVDRVLHGRGGVNEETRKRILDIARDYTPSRAGKALVTKAPIRIGIVINNTGNPFFDDVLRGMDDAVRDYADFPLEVLVRPLRGYAPGEQLKALDGLEELRGLLITPVNHPMIARRIDEMTMAGCPVIAVNTDVEHCKRILYVGCNDTMAGRTAGQLMALMCQSTPRALVVVGSLTLLGHQQRAAGFEEALKNVWPDAQITVVENNDDDAQSFSVVQAALQDSDDCVYFAAAGAVAGVQACEERGINPRRIITSDATPDISELVQAGRVAATICQQPYLQGYQAMKALLALVLFDTNPEKDKWFTQSEIKLRYHLQ